MLISSRIEWEKDGHLAKLAENKDFSIGVFLDLEAG